MSQELILPFADIDRSMVALVGGKGANLGEMTRAGIPVPPGFCLTTTAYDRFAKGLELDDLEAEEARRLLAARSLDEECRAALAKALAALPKGTLFSVRSSATAEDLPFASFAGQQDTYLGVRADGLEEAVKACFVSLYTDRAVAYRRQNGIERPSMSVVVQQMVASDSSGVMFTADPVSGRRATLVIDAIFGLGEAIVSGLVSPDHIEYDKVQDTIIATSVARKAFGLFLQGDGGTRREELDSAEPVLVESQVRQLVELGKQLEEHYGAPQDVEWAFEGERLFCLQTRAITSLYPAPEPFADGRFHFLYNMGYQQMNPRAMPVMALDCMMGAVNIDNADLRNYQPILLHEVGQHAFADFSMVFSVPPVRKVALGGLISIADPLVGSAIEELVERGHQLPHPDMRLAKVVRKAAKSALHFLRAKDPEREAAAALAKMQAHSDYVVRVLGYAPSTGDAMSILFRSLNVVQTFADLFMPMVMSGILALKGLERMEERMGCKGRWTNELQVGNAGNIVTEMGLDLGDLADLVAADKSLAEELSRGGDDLGMRLGARDDAFGAAWRAFMERYGFRCSGELDVSQPRYDEDPTLLVGQILAMAAGKEAGSHRQEYGARNARAQQVGVELVRAVDEQLGSRQARKARVLLSRYRAYSPWREHFKYYWMRTFGAARRLLLRVGEELVSRGQLERAEDIMHLHMREVQEFFLSKADLRELVDERRVEYERVLRLTPPRIITSEGEVLMGGLKRADLPEGALAGLGVSPGVVEGTAKVVLDPKGATVEKGEILVAPYTDPGWTPLFVDAAGVVCEVGGMLTHGAVVAREYGIPGVVGVVGATEAIHTGDTIRVDGTAGVVEILQS